MPPSNNLIEGKPASFDSIDKMAPITLEEMEAVKLMNRIDTKYVTTSGKLDALLEKAAECGYMACSICGEKITPYHSMYYDTEDLKMFRIHRAGKMTRQKIRVRTYVLTNSIFLEIKRKNNKGRTKKKRIEIPSQDLSSVSAAADFIAGHSAYTLDGVSPACTTDFRRITLVNKDMTERTTIDTCLSFSNPRTGLTEEVPGFVIIELKQDGRIPSMMKKLLLDLRIMPFKVSKYCIGTVLTTPGIFPGRFKTKVRHIQKLLEKENLKI